MNTKISKKLIALLLTLVMAVTVFSVAIFAQPDDSVPQVNVIKEATGATVGGYDIYRLVFSATAPSGFDWFGVALSYDNSIITPVNANTNADVAVNENGGDVLGMGPTTPFRALGDFSSLWMPAFMPVDWITLDGRTAFSWGAGGAPGTGVTADTETPVLAFYFRIYENDANNILSTTFRIETEGNGSGMIGAGAIFLANQGIEMYSGGAHYLFGHFDSSRNNIPAANITFNVGSDPTSDVPSDVASDPADVSDVPSDVVSIDDTPSDVASDPADVSDVPSDTVSIDDTPSDVASDVTSQGNGGQPVWRWGPDFSNPAPAVIDGINLPFGDWEQNGDTWTGTSSWLPVPIDTPDAANLIRPVRNHSADGMRMWRSINGGNTAYFQNIAAATLRIMGANLFVPGDAPVHFDFETFGATGDDGVSAGMELMFHLPGAAQTHPRIDMGEVFAYLTTGRLTTDSGFNQFPNSGHIYSAGEMTLLEMMEWLAANSSNTTNATRAQLVADWLASNDEVQIWHFTLLMRSPATRSDDNYVLFRSFAFGDIAGGDIVSDVPSDAPSDVPSDTPSDTSSETPSEAPSDVPSETPSGAPSDVPSETPSQAPESDAVSGSAPASGQAPGTTSPGTSPDTGVVAPIVAMLVLAGGAGGTLIASKKRK